MTSKTVKYKIPTEDQEQRAVVKWLRLHPVIKRFALKIHNEGRRTPQQARNLKLLGLRPGVADLFIAYPTTRHHGLWLEMKRNMHYPPSARKTETWILQQEWIDLMNSVGFYATFCYGLDDAIKIIEKYLHADVI